jgi:hypothetical protein
LDKRAKAGWEQPKGQLAIGQKNSLTSIQGSKHGKAGKSQMPKWQLGKGSFLAIKLMQLKMLGIVKALTKIKQRIPLIKLN